MKVKAAEGLKVPREDDPRKYITETDEVDVEMTSYYIRRLADHELQEVVDAQQNPTDAAPAAAKPKKAA